MEYTHPSQPGKMDLENPDFSAFSDVDEIIARGMRLPRYNASTDDIVYLGGHVENVRRQLERNGYDEEVQFYGLHHDSAETILGDVVRPVRSMIEGYNGIEDQLVESLWEHYGVDQPSEEDWEAVMHADDQVLMWEIDQVFEKDVIRDTLVQQLHSKNGWERPAEELIDEVARDSRLEYSPEEAREVFEESHEELVDSI